jgi:hypothetical protein
MEKMDRKMVGLMYKKRNRRMDKNMYSWADRQANRWIDRQTGRQMDR